MKKLSTLFVIAAMVFSSNVNAQTSITKIQSLYIYNFIKNIQWQNVTDEYVIGVMANEKIVEEINSILGVRKFNSKSIQVKRISSASQASSCHIVFVSTQYASQVKKIKAGANLKNTLVVSEKGQINNGASIAFVLDNSKLKFKINQSACASSGLQVSKSLISLGV